jgi:hypothetical protein
MPKIPFNFNRITPRGSKTPQRQESLAPYQIQSQALSTQAQGQRNLSSGIGAAVNTGIETYQKHIKTQDDSDMIAARAAYLRMQKEEDQAIASTSNPAEVKKIGEEYDRKYSDIMSGVDAFDRPNFRNQSGKDEFTKHFTDNFNLKRGLSASDKIFALDRRNSHARIINGIKSIPESDYYDTAAAEIETMEYVKQEVKDGHLTEAEGAEKERISLANLDIERAGRKMSELDTEPMTDFSGSGEKNPLPEQVTLYKNYVDGLSHLDDGQKKQFKAKADSILKNVESATKAATKERQIEIEKEQYAYENQAYLQVIEGKRKFNSLFTDQRISDEYKRGKLTKYASMREDYNKIILKEKKTAKDEQKLIEADQKQSVTINRAFRYTPNTDDIQGSDKARLTLEILGTVKDTKMQTLLIKRLETGLDLSPAQTQTYDNHTKDLSRILGLDKESFDVFKDIETSAPWFGANPKKASIDAKTGEKFVDGLNAFQRAEVMNKGLMQYQSLLTAGKDTEASEFIKKFKTDYEKSQDDTKLYNNFFSKTKKYINP